MIADIMTQSVLYYYISNLGDLLAISATAG